MQNAEERFASLGAALDANPPPSNGGQMFKASTRVRWKRWVMLPAICIGLAYWVFRDKPAPAPVARATVQPTTQVSSSTPFEFKQPNKPSADFGVQLLGLTDRSAVLEIDGAIYTLQILDVHDDVQLVGLRPDSAEIKRRGTTRLFRLPEMEASSAGIRNDSRSPGVGRADSVRTNRQLADRARPGDADGPAR